MAGRSERDDTLLALAWAAALWAAAGLGYLTYHHGGAAMGAVVTWLLSLTPAEAANLLTVAVVGVWSARLWAPSAVKWALWPLWGPVVWLCRDRRPEGVRAAYAELGDRLMRHVCTGEADAKAGVVRFRVNGLECEAGAGSVKVNGEPVQDGLTRQHRKAVLARAAWMVAKKAEEDAVAAAWKLAGGK